ncbi:uncharacterized protein LOC125221028 [Salvia hispanica]|uniref:uncharacterized protein LOC125221028 n=1 Tax=Salvia hispanica TaxID=49212 RepID=UPI00200966A4|nr:uncharacterized protein LOC125221028 [Salvia hispanica]
MTNHNSGVGRTEPLGVTVPLPPPPQTVSSDQAVSALSSQVVQLTAMVSEMRSRMESPGDSLMFGRPPPAPPFSIPYSPLSTGSLPVFSFTPSSAVGTQTMPTSLPFLPPGFSQTLGPSQPMSSPQFGFRDTGGSIPITTRFSQPVSQPWQFSCTEQRSTEIPPISRPQMVSASSGWGPPGPMTTFGSFQSEQQRPKVKMEPPRFDGTEVNNWIRGIQFYFYHVGTPEAQRLHYVIMLFEPAVADWIWNYCSSHEFVTWPEFLDDVRRRFDPQCYVSHVGLLKKLQQIGTVYDYQLAFEKLQTKVVGVPDHVLLDLYVASLRQPIQDEVLLHRPTSLSAAFALATQLASCRQETPQPQHSSGRRQWQPRDTRGQGQPTPQVTASQASPAAANRATFSAPRSQDSAATPIVRLSAAEKAERRCLNLCFYCPEKWVTGHVCGTRILAYMGVCEDEDDPTEYTEEAVPDEVIQADLSHLLAIEGGRQSKSLTLAGKIDSATVEVLIDTGSSHDFLHPKIAEKLHLPLTEIRPFRVYVGNGASLLCSHLCKATRLSLQGIPFSIDLHILPIHGPDVILGMEWLESLGRVTTDFSTKSIEFVKGKELIVLSGVLRAPSLLSLNSFASLMSHSAAFDLYELISVPPSTGTELPNSTDEFPADLPPVISAVLASHRGVFHLPSGLPPARKFDHRIHLLPNSKPINVRPYRYPYFQKNEIERQVRDMLDQGVIQRSHSPFSSPVLLVRKKDGTFRFCIDYRALNKATVPDHFPIPTADELFDELGAARFFTNRTFARDTTRFGCMRRIRIRQHFVHTMAISSSW